MDISSREDFLLQTDGFLDKAFLFLKELGLDAKNLEIDHICLRVKSIEKADRLVKQISDCSIQNSYISCANINGRKIYIFQLQKAIKYGNYTIPCVELPYPTINHKFAYDNWEHIEFVIKSEDKTIEDFEKTFLTHFGVNAKGIKYELKSPNADIGNQLPNPTISIKSDKGFAVKFHPKSIAEIVNNN